MIEKSQVQREEIELLLPWYEKGALAPEEMERVERQLAADPDLRSQLALIQEEVTETIVANEAAGMPGNAAREKLMQQIAAEAAGQERSGFSLRQLLSSAIPAGLSTGWAMAAAAAIVVILVQAAALTSFIANDGAGDGYSVASGETGDPAQGTFILIRFNEGANIDDVASLLDTVEATIVDGPKPGGVFRLRVAETALPEGERDAILNALREKTEIVAFVAPTR
ncbi:MAG: hypothetical protein ACFCUR_08875 [Rhodomicrobiaceae bacterium]